jgi:hypothetical protein
LVFSTQRSLRACWWYEDALVTTCTQGLLDEEEVVAERVCNVGVGPRKFVYDGVELNKRGIAAALRTRDAQSPTPASRSNRNSAAGYSFSASRDEAPSAMRLNRSVKPYLSRSCVSAPSGLDVSAMQQGLLLAHDTRRAM